MGLERLHQQHLVKLGRRQRQIERATTAGHGQGSAQHDKTCWRVVRVETLRRRDAGRARQARAEPGAGGGGRCGRVALPLGITHAAGQHAVTGAGLAGRDTQHGGLAMRHHSTGYQHSGQAWVGPQLERQAGIEQAALGTAARRNRKALGGFDGDDQVFSERTGSQRDRPEVAHHQGRQLGGPQHQLVLDPLLAGVDLHSHAAAVVHQPGVAGLGHGHLAVEQRAIQQGDRQRRVKPHLDRHGLIEPARAYRTEALERPHPQTDVFKYRRGRDLDPAALAHGCGGRVGCGFVPEWRAVGAAQCVVHVGLGVFDADHRARAKGHQELVGAELQVGQRCGVAEAEQVNHPVAQAAQRRLHLGRCGIACR